MDLILLTVNGVLGVLASALALSREIIRARQRATVSRHRDDLRPPCGCTDRTPATGPDGAAGRTR